MELLWVLVIAILVLIAVGWVWQAFGVSALLATANPTQRLLIALLGLVLIIIILVWFFGRYVGIPL